MSRVGWREQLIEYIREQARPVDKYGHQPRLYALTRQVGEGLTYDDDVVFAAVWLHDLGVFIGHRPEDLELLARWDSVAYAMERAPWALGTVGFPAAKVRDVVEVIRTHQPSGEPSTVEGVIVRDADILEQLGAIAILRGVSKVGRDTRFPRFTDAMASLERALGTLPGQIRLETTRRLSEPKIAALTDFLSAVRGEAGPHLE